MTYDGIDLLAGVSHPIIIAAPDVPQADVDAMAAAVSREFPGVPVRREPLMPPGHLMLCNDRNPWPSPLGWLDR